ncbi:LrgB family protein [Pseudomonas sp. RL_15y_Pfl2_60]|uniref:LrgB family protein n=1 Tax=Pseudomonas sp. RL_15y_Pfl2_60 TaxID=3088709 RepID=UPI0030D74C35
MSSTSFDSTWLVVQQHPLFSIGLTLIAFQLALALYRRTGWLVLQPVLVSMFIVVTTLLLLGIDYNTYREGAAPIALLLGPATVALAVPLYRNLRRIRLLFWPIILTIVIGGVFTLLLTLTIAHLLGADLQILLTLATKSVTMPIAMLAAEQIGGIAALSAVFVMITGVVGTAIGPTMLRWVGVDHPAARGMTYGMNAHAIGTARALEEGEECGAFAALSMSLLGALTAVFLPLSATLLVWLYSSQ